jgi:hypothetical protein
MHFTVNLRAKPRPHDHDGARTTRAGHRLMLDWLVGNCSLLGLKGQNWMWLAGAGLALYLVTLAFARSRQVP